MCVHKVKAATDRPVDRGVNAFPALTGQLADRLGQLADPIEAIVLLGCIYLTRVSN